MNVLHGCIVAVSAWVVLTKLGDVGSTLRGLGSDPSAEQNPWARRAMVRWGTGTVAWAALVLTVVIVGASATEAWFAGPVGATLFVVSGLLVGAVQASVTLHNHTGRTNAVTRVIARLLARLPLSV